MKLKSKVRAGGNWQNKNGRKIVVKTKVRAGGIWENRNPRRL